MVLSLTPGTVCRPVDPAEQVDDVSGDGIEGRRALKALHATNKHTNMP